MGKNSPSVPLPLVLYLVTSGTARSQQLCMMAATVEMPIVVKVDEVYQGLTTGLASETGSVPAALLTSSGRKHSILSWIQQLLALPKQRPWALNLNLLSFAHGSSITFPNPHSNCSYAAGPSPPQRPTPQTWLPLFPSVYQITNPENIFRYTPPNPFCRAKRGGRERLRDEKEQTYSLPSHRCTLQAWEVTSGLPPVPWISASAGHRRAAVGSVPPPPGPDSSAPKGKAHMHPDLRTLLGLTCSLRLTLAWREAEPWKGMAHVLEKKGREFTLLPWRGPSLGAAPASTQHHHQIVWLLFPLS